MEGCRKYQLQQAEWLSMLIPEHWPTIIRTRDLIHQCLKCKSFKIDCDRSEELVELLENNFKNDLYN
jgi:hypothetical protein